MFGHLCYGMKELASESKTLERRMVTFLLHKVFPEDFREDSSSSSSSSSSYSFSFSSSCLVKASGDVVDVMTLSQRNQIGQSRGEFIKMEEEEGRLEEEDEKQVEEEKGEGGMVVEEMVRKKREEEEGLKKG